MKRLEIYHCPVCGQIVETLKECVCREMICCGKPMTLMPEQTADTKVEKHVPFVSMQDGKLHVKIGEIQVHPMTVVHFIEWIEVIDGCVGCRHFLKPESAPESDFPIPLHPGMVIRACCNLHGLWVYRV